MAKKILSNNINQIKSNIIQKILPNRFKKRQNIPKEVSNREIKSLESNSHVIAAKNIINTPKIAKISTLSKMATKPKIAIKLKKVSKSKIVIEKKNSNYDEYKNRVIKQLKKQLKKLIDSKKSEYLDYDDEEYKGIRDLEYLFEDVNENNDDYYKPILVKSSFNENYKKYESRGDKDKKLSVEQYLNMIIPYLKELINNHKAIKNNSSEWKIQLNMHIKFVSSNDTRDIRTFYVWSKNDEIRLGTEADDIVKSLISSFLNIYQKEQQVLREESNFVFDCVDLMCYHNHKTSLKRGSSYIKSPKWLTNKKAIINPKNTKCSACFAYSIIVALNHQKIQNHPERIRNIIPFKNLYNFVDIDFPAGPKDWKKFEKNNETVALNILQVPHE